MKTLVMPMHRALNNLPPDELHLIVDVRRGGLWGNPYPAGWMQVDGHPYYRGRNEAVRLFEMLMQRRVLGKTGPVGVGNAPPIKHNRNRHGGGPEADEVRAESELWIARLEAVQGKILCCACESEPCHAYVIRDMSHPDEIVKHRSRLRKAQKHAEYNRKHYHKTKKE